MELWNIKNYSENNIYIPVQLIILLIWPILAHVIFLYIFYCNIIIVYLFNINSEKKKKTRGPYFAASSSYFLIILYYVIQHSNYYSHLLITLRVHIILCKVFCMLSWLKLKKNHQGNPAWPIFYLLGQGQLVMGEMCTCWGQGQLGLGEICTC